MIVGLTGPAGSGKDTAAAIMARLADPYDLPPAIVKAFAGPLKMCAAATLGITVAEVERLKLSPRKVVTIRTGFLRRKRLTMRQYLQNLGTEGGRKVFGDTFWIDQTVPLDLQHRGEKLYIITDVRFENEAERIWGHGGFVIRVDGPTIVSGKEKAHDSEKLDWTADLPSISNHLRDDCHVSLTNSVNRKMSPIAQKFFEELRRPVAETGTDLS
jgi:energy-coupling factor transporter ATP-binding protein EcfA2